MLLKRQKFRRDLSERGLSNLSRYLTYSLLNAMIGS